MGVLVPAVQALVGVIKVTGFWKNAAVLAGRTIIAAGVSRLLAPKQRLPQISQEKLVTVRATDEFQRIVYGEDLVAGVMVYINTYNPDNQSLVVAQALTGHPCDDITDVWIDGDVVPSSALSVSADPSSGKYAGTGTRLHRYDAQPPKPLDAVLNAEFSATDWDANHLGEDIAHGTHVVSLQESSRELWQNGPPRSVRYLVRGKRCYDPRLDTSPGANPDDASYFAWTDNPILQIADYLRDDGLGLGADATSFDWDEIEAEADVCDELVTVPDGAGGSTTQKRFTSNVTLSCGDNHRANLKRILGACFGRMTHDGERWRIWCGHAFAPDVSIDSQTHLREAMQVRANAPVEERFNRVRGIYIAAARQYQPTNYAEQRNSTYETADGRVLYDEFDLTAVSDEYRAQRLAMIRLAQSRQQTIVSWPGKANCMDVLEGEVINVTAREFGWVSKKFLVTGFDLVSDGGINLDLLEWDDGIFTDPVLGDYTERNASGAIDFQDIGVAAPSGLTGTGLENGHLLTWTSLELKVEVWSSLDNVRGNAALVGEIIGGRARVPFDYYASRYYWIRAVDEAGRTSEWHPAGATAGVQVSGGPVRESQQFLDTFDYQSEAAFNDRWDTLSGTAPTLTFPNNGEFGGQVLRVEDAGNFRGKQLVPFDERVLYSVEARVRLVTAPTNSLHDRVYVGVAAFEADRETNAAGDGGDFYHYFGASDEDMGAYTLNEWQTFTGYFKGWASSGHGGEHTDINDPGTINSDGRFISPVLFTNYLGGDGVMEVDYVEINRIEGDDTLEQRICPDAEFEKSTTRGDFWDWSASDGAEIVTTTGVVGGSLHFTDDETTARPVRKRGRLAVNAGEFFKVIVRYRSNGLATSASLAFRVDMVPNRYGAAQSPIVAGEEKTIQLPQSSSDWLTQEFVLKTDTLDAFTGQAAFLDFAVLYEGNLTDECYIDFLSVEHQTSLYSNDKPGLVPLGANRTFQAYSGRINSTIGSSTLPSGWSVTNPATGRYVVTHNLGLGSVEDLMVTPVANATAAYNAVLHSRATNSFEVRVYDTSDVLVNSNVIFTATDIST